MKASLHIPALVLLAGAIAGCPRARPRMEVPPLEAPPVEAPAVRVETPGEPHLTNVRQLTFEGENAEAYWNREGDALIFQSTQGGLRCDQIFTMRPDGSARRQVSVGNGRTTCGYFQVDGSIIYASTHGHGEGCRWMPDFSQGYVWPLYPEMDLWQADADGSNAKVLFASEGYDAEATVCHRDGRVLFTSTMNGDLDLYVMERDGSNVRQLTREPGYDGGAFFSPDCSKIVWRASRPEGEALEAYRAMLARHMVRPGRLEIFTMDADGTNVRQVTNNGAANFAPYMHPDNRHIIFSSNMDDQAGRNFELYLVRVDGTGLTRVTNNPTFDGFPMWTHDGRQLVFASNRHNRKQGDTNIFVADWVWPEGGP